MSEILQAVKTTLRISHNKLDDEINENIKTATEEMIRTGVDRAKAQDTDNELIRDAIKVFCLMRHTTDMNKYDRYFQSWQYQIDCLRKSSDYRG